LFGDVLCHLQNNSRLELEADPIFRTWQAQAPKPLFTDIPQMNAGSRRKLPGFVIFDMAVLTSPAFGPCLEAG
jgi:hypothetical protein